MKRYLASKHVKAKPMSLGDYNELRGWQIPDNENPLSQGFLTEEPGEPNHANFDGHITWVPAHVFERTHKLVSGPPPLFSFEEAMELMNRKVGSFAFVSSFKNQMFHAELTQESGYADKYEINPIPC